MSFDKAKVVRAAEKFLTQGKILPAIIEYRKIVTAEPDDFTALNMLGDLYARVSKNPEAIECFSRIANHYRDQGFNLKAIAMLRKIDRLQPANPDIAYQLGTLYEAQGLAVEARAQYLVVADFYTTAGEVRKTLEILHRVADLDPHNVETRLKLAEGYLRERMPGPAGDAFTEAGAHLIARGNYERGLVAYQRALEIVPFSHEAWSGVVTAHTALNSADEAAQALQDLGVLEAHDVELIALLAQAYLADEDAPQAEIVTRSLLRLEPSGYTRMLDVARLYLKKNQLDDCVRVLEPIAEPILNARAEAALVYVLEEALARNPEHLAALHILVRVHKWCHDEERMQKTLERIVEAAEASHLPDEQYQALQQLHALVPQSEKYRHQLAQISPSGPLLPPVVAEPMPESEAAFYNSLAGLASDVATTAETPDVFAAEEIFPLSPPMLVTPDYTEEITNVSGPLPGLGFDQSFADLNEPEAAWPATLSEITETIDFSAVAEQSATSAVPDLTFGETPDAPHLDDHHQKILQQELESIDFYIGQGYHDIAQDTLEMLERQFGPHPDIAGRRAQLPVAAPAIVSSDPPPEEISWHAEAAPEAHAAILPPAADEGDALFAFTVTATANAPKTFGPNETIEPVALPTPAAEPDPPILEVPAVPASGIDAGLAAIFDEFRVAVEEESQLPADDDFETHYNLGLAYQEMELVDEAIEEFQIASKLVAVNDGTSRYLHCCSLLGHCFNRKDMPRVAMMWFQKGLDVPHLSEEEDLAMRYELGLVYEQMGNHEKAVETFVEVYGVSVTYRGVGDKLRELQELQFA